MTDAPYSIPAAPPADLIAELDAAAAALDELTARAAELRLAMDPQARTLRIELEEGGDVRRLSPTQLFALFRAA